MTWPKPCKNCRRDMWPRRSGAPRIHGGHGKCKHCYRSDEYFREPVETRSTWTQDELLTEWELLRPAGYTKRQAAQQLGMTLGAFERALYRAQAAGDPRAYEVGKKRVSA